MRAIRGAVTAENTVSDILKKTNELLSEIMNRNSLEIKDIDAIVFSLTSDLTAVYPARAAREMGFTETALFSVAEPNIDGSLKGCIRVLVLLNNDRERLNFVYLGKAETLRPDITLKNKQ